MFKQFTFLFFIFSIIILDSCKNEENFYLQVSPEALEWVASYQEEGQEMIYVNSANDTTILTVTHKTSTIHQYVDCNRDGEPKQCSSQSVIISFPDEFDSPTAYLTVGIGMLARSDVRIMPLNTGGSRVLSAGRIDVETNEVWTESDTHFIASYSDSYSYEDNTYEAIMITTITNENLPTGGFVVPKEMVYAKNGGILTWQDYDGVTWNLVL